MQKINTFFIITKLQSLLVIAMLVTANVTFAQNSKRGYYQTQLSDSISIYTDSAKILALRSPLKAVEIINKAIEWSIRKNEPINESKAYLILGTIQQNMGQHDLAIAQFRKSMLALERLENPKSKYSDSKKSNFRSPTNHQDLWFANYLRTAQSHLYLKNSNKADEFIKLCLSSEFNSFPAIKIREAKRMYAQVLAQKGQFNQAVQNLNILVEAEKLDKNSVGEIETLLLLGQVNRQMGNINQAKVTFNQAKTLANQNRLSNLAQRANEQLANLYEKEGNFEDEIDARNNSLSLNSRISRGNVNQRDRIQDQGNLSFENTTEKSVEKSSASSDANAEIFIPKKEELIVQENTQNLKRLAEVYTQKNDANKALDYYKQYAKLQDSVIAAKTNELASIIELSTNIGKNQQRIEMMEQERQLSEKSIEILQQDRDLKQSQLNNRNKIIATLSFAFASLLVGGLVVFRNLRARRKADKLLTLQSLGGQMNPHFIFNALNSVNEYIASNDERAANRYLSDFSKLMRKVLDDSRHAFIPLSEELSMLKLYLQLEHARFKDKFDYKLIVDEKLFDSDLLIPPMLVQPYIENAIWHGLRYLDLKGNLIINVGVNEQAIVISIVDNGIGIEQSKAIKTKNQKKQESMGMKNIDTRVKLINELYQSNISVSIKPSFLSNENAGTTVIITIAQQSLN